MRQGPFQLRILQNSSERDSANLGRLGRMEDGRPAGFLYASRDAEELTRGQSAFEQITSG
jgi:hypothetical protein